MGNGAHCVLSIKADGETVSIPYGKWSQQQLVVEVIIAYKPLHVKGFPQKIYMSKILSLSCFEFFQQTQGFVGLYMILGFIDQVYCVFFPQINS